MEKVVILLKKTGENMVSIKGLRLSLNLSNPNMAFHHPTLQKGTENNTNPEKKIT